MSQEWYLAPVHVDPLIHSWYAWSHQVAPATSAMLLANSCVPILDSYLDDPESHAVAAEDPSLAGGPFVAIAPDRAGEVATLYDELLARAAAALRFAEAIAELDHLLEERATGLAMRGLYADVPRSLRGLVELTYDLHHRPGFRIIEPLLYRSDVFDTNAQQVRLAADRGGRRPFILSTPRLDEPDTIRLSLSFADARLDELFAAQTRPTTRRRLIDLLEHDDPHGQFITRCPPVVHGPRVPSDGTRVRYFGHASVLVQSPHASVLVDPVFAAGGVDDNLLTVADLPDRIDVVLLTHAHQDHVVLEALLQIRHKVDTFVVARASGGLLQDPSMKLLLDHCGFDNVVELEEFASLDLVDGAITAVPLLGEHGDLAIRAKSTYVVRLGDLTVLLAADTSVLDPALFEWVKDICGPVDVVFIGMECVGAPLTWGYGSLFSQPVPRAVNESRRTAGADAEQALALVRTLGCDAAYVYAMGCEPWVWHLLAPAIDPQSEQRVQARRFVDLCRRTGRASAFLNGTGDVALPAVTGGPRPLRAAV